MSANQMADRRQHTRFALRPMFNAVSIFVDDESTGGMPLTGHVYDISESGFRAELDEAVKPNTTVSFILDLHGTDETICGRARIIWGYFDPIEPRTRRLALQIIDLTSEHDRSRLLNWLRLAPVRRAA